MTDAPEHHNPKDADHDLEDELELAPEEKSHWLPEAEPTDGPAPSA
jgi:hypothetical protein